MLLSLFEKILAWRERIHIKRAVRSIRASLDMVGVDMSSVSDEQIEKGTVEFANIVSKTGISCTEASAAFSRMGEIDVRH